MKPDAAIKLKTRYCDPDLLDQPTDLHPVLQRILSARSISSFDDINYSLDTLLRPDEITQLSEAAELLAHHVRQASKIIVFGDYDADGATSTALCMKALNMMGHDNVSFYLPDRFVDGYGVSENVARGLVETKPDLVITVDTGISSISGLQVLAEAQIDVLVTDHHLPAQEIPRATVIVNPNAYTQSKGKNLAGVGVAFYLMLALRAQLRTTKWFQQGEEPNLAECLDLVAIGTIADLVPLDHNNRTLVNEGLKRIRAGQCSQGISKLIEISGRNQKKLSSQDIAFTIAPRINAAGRLEDMSIGVQCLLANEPISAQHMAMELDNINRMRREIQGQMTQQALSMLPDVENTGDHLSHVLFQADWHEGIVGIIASRVKDVTFRPSISFAQSESGDLKGSCRSIPGIHIRDMLDLVDKANPGMIRRFGGHAMAAGLTIPPSKLESFTQAFEKTLKNHTDEICFDNVIYTDGEIAATDLNLELAQMIQRAGPWGQRFPLPSFSGRFKVLNQRILADRHLKFEITTAEDDHKVLEAILFYASEQELKTNYQMLHIHYELNINEFRGETNLQLMIRHILPD